MFFRRGKSKVERAKEAVAERLPDREQARDQVADLTSEVADALEAAQNAITRLAASAGRKGASTTRKARKQSARLAETVSERLPDPDQMVDAYRKVTDKLFPDRAKQRRKQARKHRRGLMYRGVGIAGLGLLAGWLTAPKRGAEARQAVKEQVTRAGAKAGATSGGEEPGSFDATGTPQQPAPVTQLNRGEGVNQSSPTSRS